MHRSPALLIALAGCFLTAGCLGLLGGESSPAATDPASPTASPATPDSLVETVTVDVTTPTVATDGASGTPEGSPTPPAIPLPPGTDEATFGPPEQVASAHDAAMANTSFTARYVQVRTEDAVTDRRVVGTVRHDGNGSVYYDYRIFDPDSTSPRRVEVWSNGTVAFRAISTAGQMFVQDRPTIFSPLTFARRLEIYLRSFETGVSGYSRLGTDRVVRVSGRTLNRSSDRASLGALTTRLRLSQVEDGSFSAEFSGGMLRRYRLEVSGDWRTGTATLREDVVFTDLGTTAVRRPPWATAANESEAG